MVEEKVLGGFEVEAQLSSGKERLLLLLTQKRTIFAHLAKLGRTNVAFASILGRLAGFLEAGPRRGELLGRIVALAPDAILSMNQENFAIVNDDIVSLTFEPMSSDRTRIVMVTKDRKIELGASRVATEGSKELLVSLLGEKAVFRAFDDRSQSTTSRGKNHLRIGDLDFRGCCFG